MGSNPLLKAVRSGVFKSRYSARQWAQMARDKGLTKHAAAWEEAARNGWDDEHYEPSLGAFHD